MPEEKVSKRKNPDVSEWGFSQAIPVLPKPAADAGPRQPELTTEEQEINALAPGTIRLPKGAPVPQEAAPLIVTVAPGTPDLEGLNDALIAENKRRATAQDWATGVAARIVLYFRGDDNLPETVRYVAALIHEAGSERERELKGKLRRSYELANIFAKKIAMLTLSEKSYDEYSSALKELAEASRLLGGN